MVGSVTRLKPTGAFAMRMLCPIVLALAQTKRSESFRCAVSVAFFLPLKRKPFSVTVCVTGADWLASAALPAPPTPSAQAATSAPRRLRFMRDPLSIGVRLPPQAGARRQASAGSARGDPGGHTHRAPAGGVQRGVPREAREHAGAVALHQVLHCEAGAADVRGPGVDAEGVV